MSRHFLAISQKWGISIIDLLVSSLPQGQTTFLLMARDLPAYGRCVSIPAGSDFTDLFIPPSAASSTASMQDQNGMEAGNPSRSGMTQMILVCIVRVSVGDPWTLPSHPDLLSQGLVFHPALQKLNLTVWLLSPHSKRIRGFQGHWYLPSLMQESWPLGPFTIGSSGPMFLLETEDGILGSNVIGVLPTIRNGN